MSESKVVKTTVTIDEQGEISIETNLPLLETTLLLQEASTYLLRQAREEGRAQKEEVKEAE